MPALAQISAGIVNDNQTDPPGSLSLLSCLHLLLSRSSLNLSVFLLKPVFICSQVLCLVVHAQLSYVRNFSLVSIDHLN